MAQQNTFFNPIPNYPFSAGETFSPCPSKGAAGSASVEGVATRSGAEIECPRAGFSSTASI
jgi:hypothetical protein